MDLYKMLIWDHKRQGKSGRQNRKKEQSQQIKTVTNMVNIDPTLSIVI